MKFSNAILTLLTTSALSGSNGHVEPDSKERRFLKGQHRQITEKFCKTLNDFAPPSTSNCWDYNDVDYFGNLLSDQKGCDYQSCQDAVCECDDYCCSASWDLSCRGYKYESKDTVNDNRFSRGCSASILCCEQVAEDESNLDQKGGVQLVDRSLVSLQGLYFTNYAFGPQISVHGDCVKVHKGYVFVSWYKGGMSDRHLMLSRKRLGESEWHHIEFSHQHVGWRGDPTKGDSHNTVAVGISPMDDTIHLLYDMHSYHQSELPNDFFNYSFSVKGAAVVNDADWNNDLFYRKRNYMKQGYSYNKVTYPSFMVAPNGLLISVFRYGHPYNANMHLHIYHSQYSWSRPLQWNQSQSYGVYGSFSISQNKMHVVYAQRKKWDRNLGYRENRGIYYGYSDEPSGKGNWFNINNEYIGSTPSSPITDNKEMKILEPSNPNADRYLSPGFAGTDNGYVHFMAPLKRDGQKIALYYFKSPQATTFESSSLEINFEQNVLDNMTGITGFLQAVGNTVFLISLEKGRPLIRSAPAGTGNFKVEYMVTDGPTFRFGVATVYNDPDYGAPQLVIALLAVEKRGHPDQQPIYVHQFSLNGNW